MSLYILGQLLPFTSVNAMIVLFLSYKLFTIINSLLSCFACCQLWGTERIIQSQIIRLDLLIGLYILHHSNSNQSFSLLPNPISIHSLQKCLRHEFPPKINLAPGPIKMHRADESDSDSGSKQNGLGLSVLYLLSVEWLNGILFYIFQAVLQFDEIFLYSEASV